MATTDVVQIEFPIVRLYHGIISNHLEIGTHSSLLTPHCSLCWPNHRTTPPAPVGSSSVTLNLAIIFADILTTSGPQYHGGMWAKWGCNF